MARRSDNEVAVFSLEMSKEELASRMLSTESLVDSQKLRNGMLTSEDWVRLASGAGVLSGLQMYIDDTASITVQQIKAKLRRLKNLGLVVIDYLQLMNASGMKFGSREQEVSMIWKFWKQKRWDLSIWNL